MSVESVFITGAASGMGLQCALKLLSRGMKVTGFDVSPFPVERLSDEFRENYRHVVGDVSDPAAIAGAVDAALEHGGRLDRAINAAGIVGKHAEILDHEDAALDRLLAINVRGVFLSMKYEALAMRQRGGGAIVNFSSVFALAKHESMVLYGATKNAVSGLTQGAAIEFAKHGIRVNGVAPGPILTPFIGEVTPDIENAIAAGIPQKRIGDPEEVANAAIWLSSPEASYVTGTVLVIDGGQSAKLPS